MIPRLENTSLVNHILFELCLILIFSPVQIIMGHPLLETLQLFLLQNRVYSVARGAVHGAYVKQRAVLETSCTWWHCPEQPLPIGLMSKHHQLFVLENAKVKRKEKHRAASTGGISPLHNNAFWSDFHLMQLLVCLYVWSEQPNPIGLM